jgi:hypothetical protein
MKVTVLGGAGAYPTAHQGCSGFLLEHDGFRLLVDPGYATIQRLLALVGADEIDAVWVSHGHPDHCADLQPLLRARALPVPPAATPLPVYAPLGSLASLLALDQPDTVDRAYVLHDVADRETFDIGPLQCSARDLPHMVPNLGIRIIANAATTPTVVAYTGDCGPSTTVAELAAGPTSSSRTPRSRSRFRSPERRSYRARARLGRTPKRPARRPSCSHTSGRAPTRTRRSPLRPRPTTGRLRSARRV